MQDEISCLARQCCSVSLWNSFNTLLTRGIFLFHFGATFNISQCSLRQREYFHANSECLKRGEMSNIETLLKIYFICKITLCFYHKKHKQQTHVPNKLANCLQFRTYLTTCMDHSI